MSYFLLVLLYVYASADALKDNAPEQKEKMDYPTYGEPIYAPGVKRIS